MYKKLTLDNGVRIVSEKIPYVHSVSLGIWISTGSRRENSKNNGISHFIEHMLFKGTEKRTAKQIAESIDNIGGQLNAFTGKECTCFYTKTLDTHLDIAIDVLADMLFNSLFAKKDITVEKKVIIEEIGMYEDTPEELVHDMLSETLWDGNSLGYPILGTEKCLKPMNREMMQQYMLENYTPENTIIAVAGNFEEETLEKLVRQYFSNWEARGRKIQEYEGVEFKADTRIKEKDTEQVHLCVGYNGIEHGSDDLYSLLAVNNIFGGGMSSRLFQKIREKRGLVYSIYSYPSAYKKTGLFTIYAGMNPEHMNEVAELIAGEIKLLLKKGITADDLQKSKEQLKGNYILGLESTNSRMNSIGKSELMLGHINTPEEILRKIDAISMNVVHEVTERIFTSKAGAAMVGSIKPDFKLEILTGN